MASWTRLGVWRTVIIGGLLAFGVGEVGAQTPQPPPAIPTQARAETRSGGGAVIPIYIDNTGVASSRFRNRRQPLYIFPDDAARQRGDLALEFVNSSSRAIRISIPFRLLANQTVRDPALVVTDCSAETRNTASGPTRACTLTLTLDADDKRSVPIAVFYDPASGDGTFLDKSGDTISVAPVVFEVSFFIDRERPTYARGYFTVAPLSGKSNGDTYKGVESPSEVKWVLAGAAAFQREPDFGAPDRKVSPGDPYNGERRWSFPTEARVDLNTNLGNRADGFVSLKVREGRFGDAEVNQIASGLREGVKLVDVALDSYKLTVHGLKGVIFSFGRFRMAAPSDAVAIREQGDGLRLDYRHFAASFIQNREGFLESGDLPLAATQDRDKRGLILQLIQLPFDTPFLRSVDFHGVVGQERSRKATPYRYGTVGGEVFFGRDVHGGEAAGGIGSTLEFNGSLATYVSRRWADGDGGDNDDRGHATLLKATLRKVKATTPHTAYKTRRSATLTLGRGSADDPDATTRDEGYVGETGRFEPGDLFLTGLVRRAAPLKRGLRDKTYMGLRYLEKNERANLLWHLANLVGTNTDVESQSTTVRYHKYFMNRAIDESRNAGHGLDVQFLLESPKGVEQAVEWGMYWPGEATKALFAKRAWRLGFSMSITLGS